MPYDTNPAPCMPNATKTDAKCNPCVCLPYTVGSLAAHVLPLQQQACSGYIWLVLTAAYALHQAKYCCEGCRSPTASAAAQKSSRQLANQLTSLLLSSSPSTEVPSPAALESQTPAAVPVTAAVVCTILYRSTWPGSGASKHLSTWQ